MKIYKLECLNEDGDYEENGYYLKRESAEKAKKRNAKRYKFNVWNYNVGKNQSTKDNFAFEHPAIFPEQLANDHIVSWSNEGDIIFDPFMGSNTTGKMAKINNRKFIGIEKVDSYFKISEERINNIEPKLF